MVTNALRARKVEAASEVLRCTIVRNCSPESLTPSLVMFIVAVCDVTPELKFTAMLSGIVPDVVLKSPSLQLAVPSARAENQTVSDGISPVRLTVKLTWLPSITVVTEGLSEYV